MNWEGRTNGEDLGERGSWRRRREKEVSRGAEPGVRGFEEDRREMDGLEECVVSVLVGEKARECPILCVQLLSAVLAVIALASASFH